MAMRSSCRGFNWESHRHKWYQVVTLGSSTWLSQHLVAGSGITSKYGYNAVVRLDLISAVTFSHGASLDRMYAGT